MDNCMHVPRDWPDGRVLAPHRTEPGHWLMRVESRRAGTPCRRCGREIGALQGVDAGVRRRHRPLVAVPVWLELRPQR
jgi:hypothetical protein